MTVKINIENKTIFRVVIVVVAALLTLQFVGAITHALILITISAFLAIALNPPVTFLASKVAGGSRAGATGIAYLFVVTIIALFLWALIPPLVTQTSAFLNNVPEYVNQIKDDDSSIGKFVERYELDEEIEQFGSRLQDDLSNASGTVINNVKRAAAALVNMLTVLVLTFFMIVEGPIWINKLWDLQPKENKKHRQDLVKKMYGVITGYVNGQLTIALLAAFAALIVMVMPFVSLPFALPLAGIVGLFGLIPMVGATLGATIVVMVALFKSVYIAIGMAIFFLVYQQIENNVIQPYIQSKAVDISPLLVLVAVIIGISLGGILGGFIAIPVAAIIRILIIDYMEQNKIVPKKAK